MVRTSSKRSPRGTQILLLWRQLAEQPCTVLCRSPRIRAIDQILKWVDLYLDKELCVPVSNKYNASRDSFFFFQSMYNVLRRSQRFWNGFAHWGAIMDTWLCFFVIEVAPIESIPMSPEKSSTFSHEFCRVFDSSWVERVGDMRNVWNILEKFHLALFHLTFIWKLRTK